MNIRIDEETEGTAVVLHIAGRLSGDAITQLTNACESLETHYVLDLSKMMFADDAGVVAIRMSCERGAEIRGASPFVKLLIYGETKCDDNT